MTNWATTLAILVGLATAAVAVQPEPVITVDLLRLAGVDVNGAGPLLVRADPPHNRIVLANTLTSSVSIIDGATHRVRNVATTTRVPQYLKSEALAISGRDGTIVVIGERTVHVIPPGHERAISLPTGEQYESAAIDEQTGKVLLASRASEELALVDPARGSVQRIPWTKGTESFANLNQTPPPPLRKVVADPVLGRFVAVDGTAAMLHLVDPGDGRVVSSRALPLTTGGRWHLAGYDPLPHALYLVTETAQRKVMQAAKIRIDAGADQVVALPGLAEGVGITCSSRRDELYIGYDNDPTLHVVDFKAGGQVTEVLLPAYGNDAAALDEEGGKLYVASWAFGEIDRVSLETRSLEHRYKDLGVIPHMFSMAFNPATRRLYIPLGASAVNGSFGAAVTALDPATGATEKVRTGWAPIDITWAEKRQALLAFSSEDAFAEVTPGGEVQTHPLPFAYPIAAGPAPGGDLYLAYGPHQSYWPVVYIWGSKNGLLLIKGDDLSFSDRRLPRQAHRMVLDQRGALYLLQNSWGKEKQFLTVMRDVVREFVPESRLELDDTFERENTPRLLAYDAARDWLIVGREAETDGTPGVVHVIDLATRRSLHRQEVGLSPTHCVADSSRLYVANFGSDSISVIDTKDWSCREIAAGKQPLRLAVAGDLLLVANHGDRTVTLVNRQDLTAVSIPVPCAGRLDNLAWLGGEAILTAHAAGRLEILSLDPAARRVTLLHRLDYPFGDTRFDSRNVAFFLDGQYGDAVFEITRILADPAGRLWVSDFLSGKVFLFDRRSRAPQ
ncbi:MAG: hypothetical protein V1750_08400 [Acidobacteriota bacterium]